jgi:glycosyltransferase EpsE
MTPRVSVISTVYNGAAYRDRAVPSILAQSLADFEWVIVDDGSDDETPRLLAELAARDPRVRVLSAGRLGRAAALNLAAENARSNYIANQDFDDLSAPERLAHQAAFLDSHPEVGWLGGYYIVIDENRDERYIRMPATSHAGILREMAKNIPFAHTTVMFRKQAWVDAGGYPAVTNLVDFRLVIALAGSGWHVANVPEVLGTHHVHPASFWHQHFRYRDRQLELAAAQREAIRKLGLPAWMQIWPLGRRAYSYLPHNLKRRLRRTLAASREHDLSSSNPMFKS